MIRVFEPEIWDEDIDEVVNVLKRGEISGSFGEALDKFEAEFSAYVGCRHGVATTSGTTALHLALAAAGIGAGDEVIVSSSTNIATALAPVYLGAMPIPIDAETDSWNIDPSLIESLITKRTRAIVPVHLFGNPARMDIIMAIAEKHGLLVIEDCAQAHGARWKGQPVGSFGHMAAFSFYANKIITTGEGGMVTTNDEALASRMRYLKNLAFGNPRFVHKDVGFNYRMTAYQAGLGLAQLSRIDEIIKIKKGIDLNYRNLLEDVRGITWQKIDDDACAVHWMVGLKLNSETMINRDNLAKFLAERGIETRNFFCPMNMQPVLQKLPNFAPAPCPVSDSLWECGLYLPSSLSLSQDDQSYIAKVAREAIEG